jgi:hypothetical protein
MAIEDRVGMQRGARRGRLPGGSLVDLLGALVGADHLLVGVEHGRLCVDVQRHDVQVTVGGEHEPLQHPSYGAATRSAGSGHGLTHRRLRT